MRLKVLKNYETNQSQQAAMADDAASLLAAHDIADGGRAAR